MAHTGTKLNVLLIGGEGRDDTSWCDPGIHFSEIQRSLDSAFGGVFTYRTWMHDLYYDDRGQPTGRPCVCQPGEMLSAWKPSSPVGSHVRPPSSDESVPPGPTARSRRPEDPGT